MTLFYGCTLAHCMGMMWLYVAREFPEQSDFVPTPQQLALDAPSLYLAALYWGFGACVGTINPGEPAPGMQSVFSIFVSFTGVLFVAYTIGSVHRMVGHMQKSVAALRHKLNTVDRFMKHNDMPTELRDKVLRYHTVRLCCMLCCTHLCGCVVAWLCVSGCARVPVCVWLDLVGHLLPAQFLFDVSGGRGEEEEALRQLPRCVRFELSYALVRDTVRQVPLFSGCPESLLRSLVRLLRPQIAVAEEVVVEARTFVAELFIVHWGRLSVSGKSPSARRQLGVSSMAGTWAVRRCVVGALHSPLRVWPVCSVNFRVAVCRPPIPGAGVVFRPAGRLDAHVGVCHRRHLLPLVHRLHRDAAQAAEGVPGGEGGVLHEQHAVQEAHLRLAHRPRLQALR